MPQARDELADLITRVVYGHEPDHLEQALQARACLIPPEDLTLLEQTGQEQISLTSAGAGRARKSNRQL